MKKINSFVAQLFIVGGLCTAGYTFYKYGFSMEGIFGYFGGLVAIVYGYFREDIFKNITKK